MCNVGIHLSSGTAKQYSCILLFLNDLFICLTKNRNQMKNKRLFGCLFYQLSFSIAASSNLISETKQYGWPLLDG